MARLDKTIAILIDRNRKKYERGWYMRVRARGIHYGMETHSIF